MGQFSYACKSCGGRDQFDWVTSCVVELALTTGKTIHVEGYYDGYGGVICRVGEDQQVKVYDKQFEEYFEHWGEVQILSRGIMCNGSLPAGPRGAPPPRLCVPAGVRVLKRMHASPSGATTTSSGSHPRTAGPKETSASSTILRAKEMRWGRSSRA